MICVFRKEDKEKSNELLRYGIKVSKGEGFKAPVRVRFSILIRIKEELEGLGAVWQSRILNCHIHSFQKRNKGDLQAPEGLTKAKRGGDSKKVGSVLSWYKHVPDGSEGGQG